MAIIHDYADIARRMNCGKPTKSKLQDGVYECEILEVGQPTSLPSAQACPQCHSRVVERYNGFFKFRCKACTYKFD